MREIRVWMVAMVMGAMAAGAACDGPPRIAGAAEPDEPGPTGTLALALTLSGGVEIDAIDYRIYRGLVGSETFLREGTMPIVDATATASALVELPAGPYKVKLTATSADGAYSCFARLENRGDENLDIVAGQTTTHAFVLSCEAVAPDTGSVILSGAVNLCPVIRGASATPLAAPVGQQIAVHAEASDPEGSALTYFWLENPGPATNARFADQAAADTAFTCEVEGTTTLEVVVSDGHCKDFWSVEVACLRAGDGMR